MNIKYTLHYALFIISLFMISITNAHVASNESFCSNSTQENIGSTLNTGDQLLPGQRLTSSDPFCAFELRFKKNPNTNAYYLALQTPARTLWIADLGTSATSPVAQITSSGRLEVRQGSRVLFTTSGYASLAKLTLQQDGNFVITDSNGKVVYDLKNKRTDGKRGRPILGDKLYPGEYLAKNSYLEEKVTTLTAYPHKPQAKLTFNRDGEIKAISNYRNIAQAPLLNSDIIMATASNRASSDAQYLHLNNEGQLITFDRSGTYVGQLEMFRDQPTTNAILEYAMIGPDFNFAVYWSKNGTLIKSIQSDTKLGDRMYPGETLYVGMELSVNGYKLRFQSDGNFVIYNNANQCHWEANSQSHTATQNLRATFQLSDGNFVLYTKSSPTSAWEDQWATGTKGVKKDWLARLQSDGNFVIYGSGYPGNVAWAASRTGYTCN